MNIKELVNQKNDIEEKIDSLKYQKNKYVRIKEKVNLALPQLRAAKTSINSINTYIKQYYSGSELTKKTNSIESDQSTINTMISELNNLILPEINRKINSINSQINYQEERKREIENMLDKGQVPKSYENR